MSSKVTTEMIREMFKVTPQKVDDAVAILVKLYDPLQIYVFGSYASGKYDEYGSDVDFMIVLPKFDKYPWELKADARGALMEVNLPVDLVLYEKHRFDFHKNDPMSFCTHILKTGKLLYEKA